MILKRIQILENQLFESLANARKLYSNKIDSETFDELVSIDTSKTYKYIEKICKFYLQNEDIDFDELKSNIELFDRLSSKNLIDIKDINQFKIYSSFKEYLDSNSDKMSKSEEQRLLKNKGTETILNNENVLVLLIKDEQAAIQYGSNTKWCISATDSKNYFKSYRGKRVTFYFIFNKELDSSNPNYKIAVSVYPNGNLEIYNAIDENIPNSIISDLGLSITLFKPVELSTEEKLELHIKGTYKINSKGLIDVEGDVDISDENLTSILQIGRFETVSGNFSCFNNKLTSLDGCPKKVGKNFICSNNSLTSLEGSPLEVRGNFTCSNNSLTSLEGSPIKIFGNYYCYNNSLTSLEGSPLEVRGNFFCYNNNLTSLEGSPKFVGKKFTCYFNKKKFTVKDVVKVCDVKGEINV